MNTDIKKIAIVRLSALGDIVNSAVVLQFIKHNYPTASIEWITEEGFFSILESHPLLKSVHTVNIKSIKQSKSFSALKELIFKLRHLGQYDAIIDMQGLIKSAIVSRLIGNKTYGFDKNSTREGIAALLYKKSVTISYESNVIKRNCFVVSQSLSFEISDTMILNKEPIFPITKVFNINQNSKNIVFIIGASWESKIYPKELIVKVLNGLKTNAYIIWGNEKEFSDAEWICNNSSYATLAPKLKLNELVSYISQMNLLIGNDTGPTHMAWAQNIPSITLFGPTNERMIYETPINIAIQSPSKVNILKINKNDFSIKEISVDTIITKAKELLHGL
jgi:heptosyltransferase-1